MITSNITNSVLIPFSGDEKVGDSFISSVQSVSNHKTKQHIHYLKICQM